MKRAGFDQYHTTAMVLIESENSKNKKERKTKKKIRRNQNDLPSRKHVFFRQLYAKIL